MNDREAYEMHLAGKDDFDIAEKFGVTLDEARSMVETYGNALPSPTNAAARRDEVARVDVWLGRVDAAWVKGDLPVDKAVNSFVKLSERRCKLLGLDAPSKAEIEATLNMKTPDSIDEEVQQLADELGFGRLI